MGSGSSNNFANMCFMSWTVKGWAMGGEREGGNLMSKQNALVFLLCLSLRLLKWIEHEKLSRTAKFEVCTIGI